MAAGRSILFFLAFFYVYGAGVHAANMLSLTGFDWGAAPLKWQALDVVYLLLSIGVALGLLMGRRFGIVLLVVAAASQILLYTIGRAWITDVPPAFALSPSQESYLTTLVGFHIVALGLAGLAAWLMEDAPAPEKPPAAG
ncbi:MAG: hypothetical protein AAFX03_14305 [Pseudomonadota bacterium]